jgi:hypothetical protein
LSRGEGPFEEAKENGGRRRIPAGKKKEGVIFEI